MRQLADAGAVWASTVLFGCHATKKGGESEEIRRMLDLGAMPIVLGTLPESPPMLRWYTRSI